jgi:hypothetical protein
MVTNRVSRLSPTRNWRKFRFTLLSSFNPYHTGIYKPAVTTYLYESLCRATRAAVKNISPKHCSVAMTDTKSERSEETDVDHNANQYAGPNPDPMPPLEKDASSSEIKKTLSKTDPLGPPPNGGKEAWLVVLGGFLLMYVSFGYSESTILPALLSTC